LPSQAVPTPSRDTVREVRPRRIGSPGSIAHPFLVAKKAAAMRILTRGLRSG
jgi:hypothetical protein